MGGIASLKIIDAYFRKEGMTPFRAAVAFNPQSFPPGGGPRLRPGGDLLEALLQPVVELRCSYSRLTLLVPEGIVLGIVVATRYIAPIREREEKGAPPHACEAGLPGCRPRRAAGGAAHGLDRRRVRTIVRGERPGGRLDGLGLPGGCAPEAPREEWGQYHFVVRDAAGVVVDVIQAEAAAGQTASVQQ
jgi:hypothetical protein